MYFLPSEQVALVHAPAKLNLFLEVLARRSDGFHEIETLITAITIFDTLRFANNLDGQLRLTCRWATGVTARRSPTVQQDTDSTFTGSDQESDSVLGSLPGANSNIVTRVLEGLRAETNVKSGATIELTKRIPSAAGLGGASSNAAAALVAANHMWRLGWSRKRLAEFSAQFGSDIPFFFTGGMAVCRGRGEVVEPTGGFGRLEFVVVRPPQGLSTAKVYADCRVPDHPARVDTIIDRARSGRIDWGRQMMNRLQEPAEELSPWIVKTRSAFDRFDCLGHQLSGSGTSYFGICRNARHARRLASRLRAAGIGSVFYASSLTAPHTCL